MPRKIPSWQARLDDPTEALYPVAVVADLLDVDPQVIRRYDAAGITNAERSEGNQRRYSRNEIAALAHATSLADQGLSRSAIVRIVALEHEVADLRRQIEEQGTP
jgi:DNA-binding transcriptional MerR regulator